MDDDLLNPHSALVYMMVLVSAVDGNMTDRELRQMGEQVPNLPVFEGFDEEKLVPLAEECAKKLSAPNGLDQILNLIVASLPNKLCETAYAIACEIAAADQRVAQEELNLLEQLCYNLGLDRLTAAAIERGIRARHISL